MLYVRLNVKEFDFHYIPLFFLVYVVVRGVYVIKKKAKQNMSVLTDIFIWGFKLFLSIQVLLVTLKFENVIIWKWRDVFWAYWVFFSIMVGINIGFIIILFSKCYAKCQDDEIESYELKGLFWLFLISNALTVNTTLYITSLVTYFDSGNKEEVYFGFQYGVAFVLFIVFYTLITRKGINLFLYKITKDEEHNQEKDIVVMQDINVNDSNFNGNNQQNNNQSRRRRSQNNNQNNQQEDDPELEEQSASSNQSNQNRQGMPVEGQQKKKNKKIKRVAITDKILGFPLFFQKLSSTYFKSFSSVPKNNNDKRDKHTQQNSLNTKNKEDIKKNIIINYKSGSFMSSRGPVSPINQNFYDVNFDSKYLNFAAAKMTNDTNQKSPKKKQKNSLLPVNDPKLKQMAVQIEQFPKGQEIQKKIQLENQKQDNKENEIKQNFSLEEKPKFHFVYEKELNELNLTDEESRESSQIQRNLYDNPNGSQSVQQLELNKEKEGINNRFNNQLRNKHNGNNNSLINTTNQNQFTKQLTHGNKQIEINNNLDNSNNNCVVCFDKQPDSVYMPCGHGGLCQDCAIDIMKKTGECFLCRNVIQEVYQVDLKSKEAVTHMVDDISVNPETHQSQFELDHQQQQQSDNFQNSFHFRQLLSPLESQTNIQFPLQQQDAQSLQHNNLIQQQRNIQQQRSQNNQLQQQIQSNQSQQQILQQEQNSQQHFQLQQQQNIQNQQSIQQELQNLQSQNSQQVNQNNNQQEQITDRNENVENRSFQDSNMKPNTLNIHQNYFQKDEEGIDFIKESQQIKEFNIQQDAHNNLGLQCEIDPQNELIVFDSEENESNNKENEDKNKINESHNIENEGNIKDNDFIVLDNFASVDLKINSIPHKQLIPQNEQQLQQKNQNQKDEISLQELNQRKQEILLKPHIKEQTYNEGSMKQEQKINDEEDVIQLPTENT